MPRKDDIMWDTKTADDEIIFDNLRIYPSENTIRNAEQSYKIEPRVMKILLCLMQSHGSVVPKDKLISTVWPNVIATDESLAQGVSKLRRALKKLKATQVCIRTFCKSGYKITTT